MPVVQSKDVLKWQSLTEAIQEIRSPLNFLKNNMFGRDIPKETKLIELSTVIRGRRMAPFVKRGTQALVVEGRSERFDMVEPPHIRIKRPITPNQLLENRMPGTTIFPTAQNMGAAMRAYLADEQSYLLTDILNTEEWLAAQALRMKVDYTSKDEVSFEVVFPRSASHTVTLAGADLWTAGTANIRKNVEDACELISNDSELTATDMILGTEAYQAFVADAKVQSFLNTQSGIKLGALDLTASIPQTGARFLGVFGPGPLRVWSYGRKILNPATGLMEDMIRSKFVEFVTFDPAAENVTYYGPIEDMEAIGPGRVLAAKRFSKSWETADPSARWMLAEANPICVPRRPDSTVSMQVVS